MSRTLWGCSWKFSTKVSSLSGKMGVIGQGALVGMPSIKFLEDDLVTDRESDDGVRWGELGSGVPRWTWLSELHSLERLDPDPQREHGADHPDEQADQDRGGEPEPELGLGQG